MVYPGTRFEFEGVILCHLVEADIEHGWVHVLSLVHQQDLILIVAAILHELSDIRLGQLELLHGAVVVKLGRHMSALEDSPPNLSRFSMPSIR